MKRIRLFIAAAVLIAFSAAANAQTPKYVFYMIGDGMGINQVYAAEAFNKATGKEDINLWSFPVRSYITTYSANSLVTDSSAAGTALASGVKINNAALGIDPEGNSPVTVAEYAKAKGMGTGIVTSVGVNHATPASFYAHVKNRNSYTEIGEQLINSKIDFAGGSTFLATKGSDPQELFDKAREAGIKLFCGRDEYKKVKGERVIYLSNDTVTQTIPYAIDRKEGEMELADYTEAAIDYLYSNFRKGFFLMIEGGKIDYACHAEDAATTVMEVLDFTKSIDLAIEFYKKHPSETVIIVTADHETGGFTMGAGQYAMHPEILVNQKVSKDALSAKIAELRRSKNDNVCWNDVKSLFKEQLGLWDTVPVNKLQERNFTEVFKTTIIDNSAEMDENLYSKNDLLTRTAIEFFDKAAMITLSFNPHSGAPVPLFVLGAKAESFRSCTDNTDIPKTILEITRWK